LDGSATLKQHGFDKIQELAKKVLKRFKISKPATHVGLMEFSNDVTPVLPLNELYDLNEVNKVIDKIKPSGGEGTATDDVLKKAANQMFTVPAGGRADAGKVLVIITDSKSTGKEPLKEAVKPLQDKGIRVFVVDIGDKTDPGELRDVTPSDEEINKVKDPEDAPKVSDKLSDNIQRAIEERKYDVSFDSCRSPVLWLLIKCRILLIKWLFSLRSH
jgi:uncharacterized protein with von Willebrand factor type A (vWA) domain